MRALLWLTVMVTLAAFMTRPLADPDLWWHIAAGRWISNHWYVPTTDLWSVLHFGEEWRAYSWIIEIPLSFIESISGLSGLIFSTFALALLLNGVIAFCCGKLSGSWFVGLLSAVTLTLGIVTHYSLRPQSFALILFTIAVYLAILIKKEGFSSQRILWLLVAIILQANTHISTVLTICGVGAVLLFRSPVKSINLTIALLFASFLTPYLGGEWLTLLGKFDHPSHFREIAEFQKGSLTDSAFFIMLLVLTLSEIFSGVRIVRLDVTQRLFLYFLAGLSFWATKFTPFATIYALLSLSMNWNILGASNVVERLKEGIFRLEMYALKIPELGAVIFLLGLSSVLYSKTLTRPLDYELFPVKAADYIRKLDLPGPILNSFNTGGFLIYRLSDSNGKLSKHVSIDGRTNTISPEHRSEYLKFALGNSTERYTEMILPGTVVWARGSAAARLMDSKSGWCRARVFSELHDPFLIWVRRDLVSPDIC